MSLKINAKNDTIKGVDSIENVPGQVRDIKKPAKAGFWWSVALFVVASIMFGAFVMVTGCEGAGEPGPVDVTVVIDDSFLEGLRGLAGVGPVETEITVNVLDGTENFGHYDVVVAQTRAIRTAERDGRPATAYIQMFGHVFARVNIEVVDFYVVAKPSGVGGDKFAMDVGRNSIWNSYPAKLNAGDTATFTVTLIGPPTDAIMQGFTYDLSGIEYRLAL